MEIIEHWILSNGKLVNVMICLIVLLTRASSRLTRKWPFKALIWLGITFWADIFSMKLMMKKHHGFEIISVGNGSF